MNVRQLINALELRDPAQLVYVTDDGRIAPKGSWDAGILEIRDTGTNTHLIFEGKFALDAQDDTPDTSAAWWIENANTNDAEDCEACGHCEDLCPVHRGIDLGIQMFTKELAKKLHAIADDPELLTLIPDPQGD